jgi:SAM-dependent methyltransferase
MQATTPYALEPLRVEGGIPVFSEPDAYLENYTRIANDHLAHLAAEGTNPFIAERLWREMEDSTIRLLQKHTRNGDRVLDAGVGLGTLLSRLPALQRYGVDISRDYLERARETGINVCLARLEDLPYNAEFFDAVTCTDVLEHVLDLNRCIAKLLSVLKPDGLLLIRVPYREDLAQYAGTEYPYEYAHVRSFDEHSLRLLFTKIFRTQVVEWSTAGNWPTVNGLKFGHAAPIRLAVRALAYVLRANEFLRTSWLSRALFHPIEINFVVRKLT